jgi:hypothetical protein
MTNTIMTSHTIGISQAGGIMDVSYCIVYGNAVDFVVGGSSFFTDVVTVNPLFMNPAAGDYHLA